MKIITKVEDLTLEEIAKREDIDLSWTAKEVIKNLKKCECTEIFTKFLIECDIESGDFEYGMPVWRLNEALAEHKNQAELIKELHTTKESEYNGLPIITEFKVMNLKELKDLYTPNDKEYQVLENLMENGLEEDVKRRLQREWEDGIPNNKLANVIYDLENWTVS